jgi:hypothetical protein
MRMWILAATLAALSSWPAGVRAQDLDSVTRRGGLVLAYASVTFIESGDEDVLQRAHRPRRPALHEQTTVGPGPPPVATTS